LWRKSFPFWREEMEVRSDLEPLGGGEGARERSEQAETERRRRRGAEAAGER